MVETTLWQMGLSDSVGEDRLQVFLDKHHAAVVALAVCALQVFPKMEHQPEHDQYRSRRAVHAGLAEEVNACVTHYAVDRCTASHTAGTKPKQSARNSFTVFRKLSNAPKVRAWDCVL